ncbi:tetratricopeptide repeat protein, partial [Flavobacterium sp. W22_SRS_FK3]|uniref:tetratricopeptide repeat protein n=1 Tax=Flavobacterium sp. W22_SRS_FK3 TaxID=3240275 RepID=UPI003F8EF9B4
DNDTELAGDALAAQHSQKENRNRIKESKTNNESSEKDNDTELTDNVFADHDSQKENRSETKKTKTKDELVKKSSKKDKGTEFTDNAFADHGFQKENRSGSKKSKMDTKYAKKSLEKNKKNKGNELANKQVSQKENLNQTQDLQKTPIDAIRKTQDVDLDSIVVDVIDIYEGVVQNGYGSVYIYKELANHYFFKNEMEKAVKWYEQLFDITKDLESIYFFRFGDALNKIGKTEKGKAMKEKFYQLVDQ